MPPISVFAENPPNCMLLVMLTLLRLIVVAPVMYPMTPPSCDPVVELSCTIGVPLFIKKVLSSVAFDALPMMPPTVCGPSTIEENESVPVVNVALSISPITPPTMPCVEELLMGPPPDNVIPELNVDVPVIKPTTPPIMVLLPVTPASFVRLAANVTLLALPMMPPTF